MLGGTGDRVRVANLDQVIGDGLDHLPALCGCTYKKACARSLRETTSQPATFLPETRARPPAASIRRIPPRPWEIPSVREGCEPSPSAGSGRGAPVLPANRKESHRRIAHATWSCRGATERRFLPALAARAVGAQGRRLPDRQSPPARAREPASTRSSSRPRISARRPETGEGTSNVAGPASTSTSRSPSHTRPPRPTNQ